MSLQHTSQLSSSPVFHHPEAGSDISLAWNKRQEQSVRGYHYFYGGKTTIQ